MRGAASLARRVLPNFGMALFYLAWSGCFRLVAEAIAIHIFWATYGLQASNVFKVHLQSATTGPYQYSVRLAQHHEYRRTLA